LTVHPRYKDNVDRYIKVVRAVAISESAPERMQRITRLESELLDPTASAEAALQLEAIGPEGADTLLKGIKSKDPEVRFYAAEALAYLDRREAAEPLGQIARDQPAFRVFAFAALGAMQDNAAYDQLHDLLSVPSAETRYGAFRALWTMNQNDPLVKGESLGGQFNYHLVNTPDPPMIHVTRSRLAEIVVFGPQQRLLTPLAVNAGNDIMITGPGGDQVCVSKYSVPDGDQKRLVSTRVDEIIRAVVELGGTYPDVVQALQEAKASGALPSRLEVDALPKPGRTYDRIVQGEPDENDPGNKSSSGEGVSDVKSNQKYATDADFDHPSNTKKGFFARMLGR